MGAVEEIRDELVREISDEVERRIWRTLRLHDRITELESSRTSPPPVQRFAPPTTCTRLRVVADVGAQIAAP